MGTIAGQVGQQHQLLAIDPISERAAPQQRRNLHKQLHHPDHAHQYC
jgi:hypothetical protein